MRPPAAVEDGSHSVESAAPQECDFLSRPAARHIPDVLELRVFHRVWFKVRSSIMLVGQELMPKW
jgi:hypothetical protein